MPNLGKKSGGAKAAGKSKRVNKEQQAPFGFKRKSARERNPVEDDVALNPEVAYESSMPEQVKPAHVAEKAEPFSDGLVSPRLRGLTVILHVGGEDTAALHDFLELFSKTETSICATSSKTSFMKKTGGRLL